MEPPLNRRRHRAEYSVICLFRLILEIETSEQSGEMLVVKRRALLRRGFWAGIGILAAGSLAAAADLLNPRGIRQFANVVSVPADQVAQPGGPPFHVREGRFWLVNLKPGDGVPDRFRMRGEPSRTGGLLALYEPCTHLGAPVPWRSEFEFDSVVGWFRCPTHGATFTKAGVRVFGPAARSMDTFAIVGVSSDTVRVNTGHLFLGGPDDPQRTTPAGPFGLHSS